MKFVKLRVYIVFLILMASFAGLGHTLYQISNKSEYIQAAEQQSTYKLNVAHSRGIIYDCNIKPLVSKSSRRLASVAPTIEAVAYLNSLSTGGNYSIFSQALENGKPFLLEVEEELIHDDIMSFEAPVRYSGNQPAPHIVGYLDSLGNGASGIELAMNDVLSNQSGEISVYYHTDAMGRVLPGDTPRVKNSIKRGNSGISLTIDESLQLTVQKYGKRLGRGAVVVTEAPSCKILALASFPDFSPASIQDVAADGDSPLINRAFSAYSPGSVFKLVTAAEQLEEGSLDYEYNCTGSISVDGMEFHCINGYGHGKVSLDTAVEKSCNCYFISMASKLGGQAVLKMAYNMGLGTGLEFGSGLFSSAGSMPSAAELSNKRALANFSFGQGSLTVTPLQIAGVINTIASYGEYSTPKLISGYIDDNWGFSPYKNDLNGTMRVMSASSAGLLQEYMEEAVKNGTGKIGASENYISGAKTGTAQTGQYSGDRELNHYWYAGYIRDKSGRPKYSIVVFREAVAEDQGVTAEIFKEIAEYLTEQSDAGKE